MSVDAGEQFYFVLPGAEPVQLKVTTFSRPNIVVQGGDQPPFPSPFDDVPLPFDGNDVSATLPPPSPTFGAMTASGSANVHPPAASTKEPAGESARVSLSADRSHLDQFVFHITRAHADFKEWVRTEEPSEFAEATGEEMLASRMG